MENFQIKNIKTGQIIYEGRHTTFKHCVESAVDKKINLKNADLKNKNLQNLNIDTAQLSCAIFDGSNLNDANLSEGIFDNASFRNTTLIGACMAESNFNSCDFSGAHFGGNIIDFVCLNYSKFNTLSCFTLDFHSAKSVNGCTFEGIEGTQYDLSNPPIIINGLFNAPLILMNDKALIGHQDVTEKLKSSIQAFLNLKPLNAARILKSLTNTAHTFKRV